MCEVEFKFDKESKEFKLLEINPRTWKWHSIADKSKINLLENYILLLQGKQTKINTKITKASFRHLLTDIPTLFRYKKLGIYKKYKSYPIQYAVWSKSDLKPALFELIYLPYFFIKALMRSILLEVNHPGQVHLFKYIYKQLIGRGNKVIVITKENNSIEYLLKVYKIPYKIIGKKKMAYYKKLFYNYYII